MNFILGVDVHAGYDSIRPIDWDAARAADVEFAIIKCTLGNDPPGDDRSFKRNVIGCKHAGIYCGAYHFGFPLRTKQGAPSGRSPREQAERAWRVSGELGGLPGELPPALDLEWPPQWERSIKGDDTSPLVNRWQEWDITAAFIVDWALEYLERIEQLSGRVPLLYTYPHFFQSLGVYGEAPAFAKYPLWIATYPKSGRATWLPPPDAKPIVPKPWSTWTFWQWSADGSPMRIPGIHAAPIDRNVFGGTRRELATLAGLPPEAPVPPSDERPAPSWDIVHARYYVEPEPEPDDT